MSVLPGVKEVLVKPNIVHHIAYHLDELQLAEIVNEIYALACEVLDGGGVEESSLALQKMKELIETEYRKNQGM